MKCIICNKETNNNFLWFKLIDFSGMDTYTTEYKRYYCSSECKDKILEKDKEAKLYYACMDESMDYNQYFIRENWEHWRYIRDGFNEYVSWFWDYKTIPKEFKEKFYNHFWHNQIFELHDRYKDKVSTMFHK